MDAVRVVKQMEKELRKVKRQRFVLSLSTGYLLSSLTFIVWNLV